MWGSNEMLEIINKVQSNLDETFFKLDEKLSKNNASEISENLILLKQLERISNKLVNF